MSLLAIYLVAGAFLALVALAMCVPSCVVASRPRPQMPAGCACLPCPGRGNDGHGMTHRAECCFGTGVEADIDCPIHGERAGGDLDAWLAMSPTPMFDRLSIEFFDAALGDETGGGS